MSFDKTIGYGSLDDVDYIKQKNCVKIFRNILDSYNVEITEDTKILVAGAGNGIEGVLVKDVFNCIVNAVDLNLSRYIIESNAEIDFSFQDLMSLSFSDYSFSLIYNIHVLEHVPDHYKVLSELHRVLVNGGILLIGFPNKNRILGYISPSIKVGFWDIIKWNFNDLGKRLIGKFDNKYGAHAGFTQKEFINDAQKLFKSTIPIRNEYMSIKYRKYKHLIKLLIILKLEEFIFPSNYFICIK